MALFYPHYDWIGLRENLQETRVIFPLFLWGFPADFPFNQSIDITENGQLIESVLINENPIEIMLNMFMLKFPLNHQ